MSSQITVRLPEQTVDWLDSVIAKGGASSRAVIIEQALVRERLRRSAEADAAILAAAQGAPGDDMDDLAAYAARTPMDDLA
ncbi:ribbon-helix-helix domain-containing protein [Nocardia sp. NPDC058518]|uniref:ribbon-helix-helix domain-containing protein n=1 Tax=Nocardia sp. NPDC058518 TaxID=3346534 RepID=UPI003661396C